MSKKFDKIQFRHQFYQGYGGPDVHEIRVVYDNRELDVARCGSEWEAATATERLKAKWRKKIADGTFEKAIKRKKKASELCAHCGGDTLDGVISTVEKYFCMKCEPFIEQHKAEFAARQKANEEKWDAEIRRQQQEYEDRAEEARSGFHWRDSIYFKRMGDGSVRVSKVERSGGWDGRPERQYIAFQIMIPPPEWASIVSSVSAEGETGPRWEAAQDFHGRPSR